MSRFIHTFTAIYRTQMTEVPSMFGVEKNPAQGAWMNEIDQWRLKVYFWEERKRHGQWWEWGHPPFTLLYLFWLSQWLSSCGSILVLKDWCQKHTTDLGTNILKKKKGISFEHLGPSMVVYASLPIWQFISLSRWGGIRCGAESGGSPAREAGKQNVDLDWQICYVEQHGHVQVHKTSCFHTRVLPFEVKQTFGLNIWSWWTVRWMVLL